MADLDTCRFCEIGIIYLVDAFEGWVFECEHCGRATELSDQTIHVLGEAR